MERRLREMTERFKSAKKGRAGFLDRATYPDGTFVATVAAINNFGAPAAGIPARPFYSNMIAEKSPGWGEKANRLLRHTKGDPDAAMGLLMEGIAGQLRQAVVDMNAPPNSPVTNLLKQRFPQGGQSFEDVLQARADVAAGATAPPGKPLVQSGMMLASIDTELSE